MTGEPNVLAHWTAVIFNIGSSNEDLYLWSGEGDIDLGGQEFSPATTMRVRATDQAPLSPRNPSWWGPWSLSFQETRVE